MYDIDMNYANKTIFKTIYTFIYVLNIIIYVLKR